MKNNNLSYSLEDLDIFTPELKGWKLHFFTVSSIVVAITTLVAQITVYRSLKRLGSRHINLMIYPSQVSEDPFNSNEGGFFYSIILFEVDFVSSLFPFWR